jgi:hypothetical protein
MKFCGMFPDFLKGHCHEIFDPRFFSSNYTPWFHGLKPFRIRLRIRRDNRHYSSFSVVNDTAETLTTMIVKFKISKRFQPQIFFFVIDTAETEFRDVRSDYLGEYEAICETVLARESVP